MCMYTAVTDAGTVAGRSREQGAEGVRAAVAMAAARTASSRLLPSAGLPPGGADLCLLDPRCM